MQQGAAHRVGARESAIWAVFSKRPLVARREQTGGQRNAAAVVPRRGSWASDVMSQETGVTAGPDTEDCVTLGKVLPLSLSFWEEGSSIFSSDIS